MTDFSFESANGQNISCSTKISRSEIHWTFSICRVLVYRKAEVGRYRPSLKLGACSIWL